MSEVRRIHHIAISIPTEHKAAARRFYGETLGFPELTVPDSLAHVPIIAWFEVGNNELHLLEEPNHAGGMRRHICFEVGDLEPFKERLDHAGEHHEPGDPIPGRPRIFCNDPAGNRIEFLIDNTGTHGG